MKELEYTVKTLSKIAPECRWTLKGTKYENIVWQDDISKKPTKEVFEEQRLLVIEEEPLELCKTVAKQLISATDWSVLPDVGLNNKSDFETYRATLRGLITNPVANPEWPTEPQPIWSN